MLLLPGPVDVPEEVMKAAAYVQNHRSDEFREIVRSSADLMSKFADAEETVVTTGSGTTAVESMLYSMTAKGEEVLAVVFGEFGERLVESLERHGCKVHVIQKTYDQVLETGEISEYVSKHDRIDTVCLIHNETGNGTSIKNLREVTKEAKGLGLKVLVDSVSGFGGIEIKANSWGIDAIAACSQKGLASVPGLGMVSLSKEGISYVMKDADVPKYLDLSISLKFLEKDETPYTPATGPFSALNAALQVLEREGIENRWKRHTTASAFVRNNLIEAGAVMYGNEANYSDTVLSFNPSVPVKDVITHMKKADIQIAKGMKSYSEKMVRVGLLGVVDAEKIAAFLNTYFDAVGFAKTVEVSSIPYGVGFDQRILAQSSK